MYTAVEAEGDNTGAGNVPQAYDNSASSNRSEIRWGKVWLIYISDFKIGKNTLIQLELIWFYIDNV